LRALLREDQATLLVLLLEDQGLDVITNGHDLSGVHVVLDRQLARGDDALGLVADVEQDLVPVDLHDGAFDNVAVVEVLDGLVDRGEEGLLGTEIIEGDPGAATGGHSGGVGRCGRARGGLDAARHVGCCSGGWVSVKTVLRW
jgi:hypothetical protein